MLAGVWVAGPVVDGRVVAISVDRFVVAVPGVTVWTRANGQARHQSEDYRQVLSIGDLRSASKKLAGRS